LNGNIGEERAAERTEARRQWDSAAPGWARWEPAIGAWLQEATEIMVDLAGVGPGSRVLDVACGAGDQSLAAARRTGPSGRVLATDISYRRAYRVTRASHGYPQRDRRRSGVRAFHASQQASTMAP
jgi:cyclopropane fatty-acyl-phospholipid synthase-like methyltransferase